VSNDSPLAAGGLVAVPVMPSSIHWWISEIVAATAWTASAPATPASAVDGRRAPTLVRNAFVAAISAV
jgi:hypothetical protein